MPILLPHVQTNYPTPISRARLIQTLKNQKSPSSIAWRYIEIDKEIRSDSFVDRIRFFNDLLIQPFLTIVFWIGAFIYPSVLEWFGFDVSFSYWNLFLWIISAIQTFIRWNEKIGLLIEYYNISSIMFQWKVITHVNRGPFITGPAEYEPLIYADAIARITASLGE